jgi:hypothetical protein
MISDRNVASIRGVIRVALQPAFLSLALLFPMTIGLPTAAGLALQPTLAVSVDIAGAATSTGPTAVLDAYSRRDTQAQPATVVVSASSSTVELVSVATSGAEDGTGTPTTASSAGAVTWKLDLYDPKAERWQDPDYTACTATAVESMLNTIAYSQASADLVWKPTDTYSKQESILAFERAHMTMLVKSAGSDAHGWRNALNYYGWGSISAGVYRDAAYTSFAAAAKAAVSAVAIYHMPVGILAWAGEHAQFVTGYRVVGDDPSTGSTNFTIVGVYLTDPYRAVAHRDTWITFGQWRSGGFDVQFSPYGQVDSPYRDPIDGQIGRREWYGKWVIVAPVQRGLLSNAAAGGYRIQ